MKILETDLFLLQLPNEWEAELDEETFVITDADEVSTLEITPFRKEKGQVDEQDLQQFTAELIEAGGIPSMETIGQFSGQLFLYEEDGAAWREWVVFAEDLILLITHGVEVQNKGLDDSMVDDILSTLVLVRDMSE